MKDNCQDLRLPPLQIGKISISPPLILAPMAGVTDDVFRSIAADHGAGLVTTEMISAEGLKRGQPGSLRLCRQDTPLRVPLSVQLFGQSPQSMAEAAKIVEANGADLVDINAGCPVKKVVKQGAGASLLKAPDQLALIVESVRKAVDIPVTVKVRLGWNERCINVVEVAQKLACAGADAVAVHARTAAQLYSGKAEWNWIKITKAALTIPVIGNGDVSSPLRALEMVRATNCDAVMIGRAAMGNPWLFAASAESCGYPVQGGVPKTSSDFFKIVQLHFNDNVRVKRKSVGHCRQLLIWYSKGFPESAKLRARLYELNQVEEMLDCFALWLEQVAAEGFDLNSYKKMQD